MKPSPLYPTGTRITTPLGVGIVRSHRASRAEPGVTLFEVQLDHESCIRTWAESELTAGSPVVSRLPTKATRVRHWVPGEAVSTLDGEGIIRNLVRDLGGAPHALVQLIGTTRSITVPCTDLSPPLEAA